MTKREFLTAISNGEMTEELQNFATAEIEKMDNSAAARAAKPSKKQLENAPLLDRIVNEILGAEPKTATEVAEVLEMSVQKASALLRMAVAQERAVQTEVKLPKKGKAKAYSLPTEEAMEEG